ncbi:unnamed protein product [Ascophyllum nodosum]
MMSWTGSSQGRLKATEDKLLGMVEGLRVFDTDIGGGEHIHAVEGGAGKSEVPLVMTHGYGMAIGGWSVVLADLSASTHVFATDWLGWGLSSRPRWELKGSKESEAFFIDSLERWREANGLKKMNLLGHSLGGYLSVAYAEKYPERVENLILASPVGVPDEPEGRRDSINQRPFTQRMLLNFVRWGWEKGVTTGDTLRTIGRPGCWLIKKVSNVRFSEEIDRETLGEYFYHNLVGSYDSGQRAVNQILKPGAWAFRPIRHRLPKLDSSIPVHFIYGQNDVMDIAAAMELKETVEANDERQKISVFQLPNSTHSLFLTNPRGFSVEVLRICGVSGGVVGQDPPTVTSAGPGGEVKT